MSGDAGGDGSCRERVSAPGSPSSGTGAILPYTYEGECECELEATGGRARTAPALRMVSGLTGLSGSYVVAVAAAAAMGECSGVVGGTGRGLGGREDDDEEGG